MPTRASSGHDVSALYDDLYDGRDRTPKEIERRCRRIAGHADFDSDALTALDRTELLNLWYVTLEHLERFDDAIEVCERRNAAGYNSQPNERCDIGSTLTRAGRYEESDALFNELWNDAWRRRNRPWAVALFASLGYLMAGEHECAAAWGERGLVAAGEGGDKSMALLLAKVRRDACSAMDVEPELLAIEREFDLDGAPPLTSWLPGGPFDESGDDPVCLA